MSVYQTEEWYVHFDGIEDKKLEIENYLNNCEELIGCNIELGDNYVFIDGFDDEQRAENVDADLREIID